MRLGITRMFQGSVCQTQDVIASQLAKPLLFTHHTVIWLQAPRHITENLVHVVTLGMCIWAYGTWYMLYRLGCAYHLSNSHDSSGRTLPLCMSGVSNTTVLPHELINWATCQMHPTRQYMQPQMMPVNFGAQ